MYSSVSVVVHHLFMLRSVFTSSSSLVRFATRFFQEFSCTEKKYTGNMKKKIFKMTNTPSNEEIEIKLVRVFIIS